MVRHTGECSLFGSLVTINLSGSHLVRISALFDAPSAPAAGALPVPHPVPDTDAASTFPLRNALLHRAGPAPPGLGFKLDHPRSLHSGEAVTIWTLHRLDVVGSGLLEIYAIPVAAHVPALLDRRNQGARFRSAGA